MLLTSHHDPGDMVTTYRLVITDLEMAKVGVETLQLVSNMGDLELPISHYILLLYELVSAVERGDRIASLKSLPPDKEGA